MRVTGGPEVAHVAMAQSAPSAERLRKVDGFLAEAWADLARHDDRLRPLAVEVRFDRGVAHLTGEVADPAELRLVRDLVGRLAGVLGVWCRVRVGGRAPVVVDLGCGATKQWPGNLGLDIYPAAGWTRWPTSPARCRWPTTRWTCSSRCTSWST